MKRKVTRRQVAAVIGIVLLVMLYVSDLVLALIGTDDARDLLKITLMCSVALPIILYGMLVAMQKTGRFRKDPADELTPEQREEAKRLMREAEEREIAEEKARRLEAKAGRRGGKSAGPEKSGHEPKKK